MLLAVPPRRFQHQASEPFSLHPFAASSSEEILISKTSLEGMPPASAAVGGMRRFFDISVPRNISSDVNDLGDDAHVYNVDDLKEVRPFINGTVPCNRLCCRDDRCLMV